MIQTVTPSMFRDAFKRADRADNFSREALDLLFDHFECMEDETGQPFELDVIAICCDYTESDPVTIAQDYSIDISDQDDDEVMGTVKDYLDYHTTLVGATDVGTLVYLDF